MLKKALLQWFNKKIKSQNLEINGLTKMIYEQNNPINWKIEPTNYETPDNEMTYGDFVIRFDHKFIRNIYRNEQIKQSVDLESLENCYKTYQKFIAISIGLLSMFNNYNKNDEVKNETSEFIEESFSNDISDELKNRIMQTKNKNALKSSYHKVPKFNLNLCFCLRLVSLFSKITHTI